MANDIKYGQVDVPGIPEGGAKPHIDIVFDGPPGPEAGRFVEVVDQSGRSIRFGEWIKRPDGLWALRLREGAI